MLFAFLRMTEAHCRQKPVAAVLNDRAIIERSVVSPPASPDNRLQCALRHGGRAAPGRNAEPAHAGVVDAARLGPVLALGRAGEFPDLRRLFIHCASLKEKCGAALGRMKAPRLIELWLRNSTVGKGDVAALAATPLFDDLRVLTFDGTDLNEAALEAIAARPCAAKLRILRLQATDSRTNLRSLARTALARPGAFPALTTLELDSPYGQKMEEPDTAEFLTKLPTLNLRHLKLSYCNFDDACAAALATNPAFAGLTRLIIDGLGATGNPAKLQPKTIRKLFQSENLRKLIELEMDRCRIGEGAEVLTDEAVLPNLARCSLSGVPEKVAQKLNKKRPVVYCRS